MKKLLIIALSIFSFSAFSAQSNSGLNGALIDYAVSAGLTTNKAVLLVAKNKIAQGMSKKQILEIANKNI